MGSKIHMACRREQKTRIDTHNMSTCQRSFKITGPARTSEGVVLSSTGQKQSVLQGWISVDPKRGFYATQKGSTDLMVHVHDMQQFCSACRDAGFQSQDMRSTKGVVSPDFGGVIPPIDSQGLLIRVSHFSGFG